MNIYLNQRLHSPTCITAVVMSNLNRNVPGYVRGPDRLGKVLENLYSRLKIVPLETGTALIWNSILLMRK